jgi:hypothetical protein
MPRATIHFLVMMGLSASTQALAGVTVQVTDSCSPEQHAAGDVAHELEATVRTNVPFAAEDFVIHEPSGDAVRSPCARDTQIHPFNDLEGAGVGEARISNEAGDSLEKALAPFSLLLRGAVEINPRGAMPHFQCSMGHQCRLPDLLRKSRGFALKVSAAGGLMPTGTYTFFGYRRTPADSAELRIPFVVLKAHTGDVLEFSLQGEVFWRSRLDDLHAGKLYFATVPDTLSRHAFAVIGLYLNAEAASDSEVFIPTDIDR